ncbi:unnamed protein product [Didymodactylos carnosus]|uniref:Uncharacterized protein n=1 Tax=Didymodactylos carnosus TaxID=1234261 RepID=A0A815CCN1_9BILA|nr:unnamed protein product [Didymodactylos carnosus]CAF1282270.1 unnamed protein product [Didymodactylos carnosus]CAF3530661.1 unnamed protein product [Didymodactylos carnosus]CAF4078518.1 unnamed protein product [Didymodactylos carnosus]
MTQPIPCHTEIECQFGSSRLQITTKMASEHKVGGTKLWHAMYMAHRGVQMLKPYVAYNVSEIKQDQFLAKDLFNSTYAAEVVEDFKQGKYKTEEKLTVKDPQSSSES